MNSQEHKLTTQVSQTDEIGGNASCTVNTTGKQVNSNQANVTSTTSGHMQTNE